MRLKLFIITIFFAGVILLKGDLVVDFLATSDGTTITLKWKSTDERAVAHYEIERSSPNQPWTLVKVQETKGTGYQYVYNDDDAFMKKGSTGLLQNTVFNYRIKILKFDNTFEYTNDITVIHSVSGIKRTWGMIKEMFK